MSQPIGVRLDPRSQHPLYRQLFDRIVERIRDGALPVGFRLPATRDLAAEVGANRNTVVRAYGDLEAAGFVTSSVGRGTFVAAPSADEGLAPREPTAGLFPGDSGGQPWGSLLSRAVDCEPLVRAERLATAVKGGALVNLHRMQPSDDLVPVDLFRRCIDHVLRIHGARVLGYAPREGLPRLKGLIAEDLRARGVPATAEEMLITTGSQQALDVAARLLVDPGDPFLVDESTYPGALCLLAAAGARLVGLPHDPAEEGPDLAALERHARIGAKGLYLMPNSQNPTGARITTRRREELVEWSRRTQVPLIEDDFAGDLELDGGSPPPALRALDRDVIHMGTFSKKLIPALRIGFMLCPRPLLGRTTVLRHAMDLGASALLQHALAEFIERGYLAAHLSRVRPEYRQRRDALARALSRRLPPGLSPRVPASGTLMWLPLPPEVDPEALFGEAQRAGVLVGPSTLSSVDPSRRAGVRLTFCAEPVDRLVEGARRFARALAVVAPHLYRSARGRRRRGDEVEAASALEGV